MRHWQRAGRATRNGDRRGELLAWLRSPDAEGVAPASATLEPARAEALRAWLDELLGREPKRRAKPAAAPAEPLRQRSAAHPARRRPERHLPPRSRRRRLRRAQVARRRRGLVLTLLAALFAAAASVAGAAFLGGTYLASDCGGVTLRPPPLAASSFIHTRDGRLLGAVPSLFNREPVPLRKMSPWLLDATLAIEDRRFFTHQGLDYQAIIRAVRSNVDSGRVVEGGSTITQQLVRNLYIGNNELTLSRKLREACLAIVLEEEWPKGRILEIYLNRIFYGEHAYGIEAAARTYFDRSADELTLTQAALLAGLPQAPSRYNPFLNPRAAKVRRNEVLRAMRRLSLITDAQLQQAVREPVRLRAGGGVYSFSSHNVFFGYALHEARTRVGERELADGLRLQATIDVRLQRLARSALEGWLGRRGDPAAALVAIDPRSGAIRALEAVTGGRRLDFNLAWQSRRQAGSAFKTFTLAAALERGIGLGSTWRAPGALALFTRSCRNGSAPWHVRGGGAGTMTLAAATAQSVNTVFAQLVSVVGPRHVVSTARRLGIRSPLKPVCAITLGSEAVSPLEMTSAYATLAAGGVYRPPATLTRLLETDGRRAVRRDVASGVTRALRGVIREGTGTAARINRPAAGKTGTAEAYRDAWFCGYVPQLAVCVWVGYPQAEIPLLNVAGWPAVMGGTIPARIWHDFMAPAVRPWPVRSLP